MPLLTLPLRTTIVDVNGGRVMLSPASTFSVERLREAGDVTDVVAPNLFHTEGLVTAALAFPNARLWGPEGIDKKVDVRASVLGRDAWPYDEVLAHLALDGMPTFRENVFFHRPSRTLIVADLAFNLIDSKGFGPFLLLSMFGTYGRFGVSKLFLRQVKDHAAFRASLAHVTAFDFDAFVPGHGAIITSGAKAMWQRALTERGLERTT